MQDAPYRNLELESVWRRPPGTLAPWCQALIALAAIAGIVVASLASDAVWTMYGCSDPSHGVLVRHAPSVVLAAGLLAAYVLPWPRMGSVSRFARVAVVVPALHLVIVLASAAMWSAVAAHRSEFAPFPYLLGLPANGVLLVAASAVVLAVLGWWCAGVSRRGRARREEWLQACLMLSLSFTFALGVWLPIASPHGLGSTAGDEARFWTTMIEPYRRVFVTDPDRLVAVVVVPPLIVATLYTAVASRWGALMRRIRWGLGVGMAVAIVAAIVRASELGHYARTMYVIAMPTLLVALGSSLVLLLGSGVLEWRRRSLAASRLAALDAIPARVATHVDQPIAELELVSWLRAPRVCMVPFEAVTASGAMPVHGADLHAPVPGSTTWLAVGERVPMIRGGDDIVLYGQRATSTGDPFRSTPTTDITAITLTANSAAAGAGAPTAALPERAAPSFRDVVLLQWRPSVAYLAIVLAISLPAVLALRAQEDLVAAVRQARTFQDLAHAAR